MAGGGGMGSGKPEMQGHHARLQAKAEEGHEEDAVHRAQAHAGGGSQREGERRAPPEQEHAEECQRPDMGGHQVDEARPPALLALVLDADEEEARERHSFPAEKEGQGMAGDQEEAHARHQEAEEEEEPLSRPPVLSLRPIAQAVDRGHSPDQEYGDEEEGAQGIKADEAIPDRGPGQGERGGGRLEKSSEGPYQTRRAGEDKERDGDALAPGASPPHEEGRDAASRREDDRQDDQGEGH